MLIAFAILAAGAARGATWINTDKGYLEDPDNWSDTLHPGQPPTEGEWAVFGNSAPDILVESTGSFTNSGVSFGGWGKTTFAIATGEEYYAPSGILLDWSSALVFSNGTVKFAGIDVSDKYAPNQTIIVTGPNTTLNLLGGSLRLGPYHLGGHLLKISDGATVYGNVAMGSGEANYNTLHVTGVDSKLVTSSGHINMNGWGDKIIVEKGGSVNAGVSMMRDEASVEVLDGGTFGNGGTIVVGAGGNANRLLVSGAGSSVASGYLGLPDEKGWGTGNAVEILDGGYLSAGNIYFGSTRKDSRIVVAGANSRMDVWGAIHSYSSYGGPAGFDFIAVTNGGTLTVGGIFNVGCATGPSNTILVADGGSTLAVASAFDVTGEGSVVDVQDGAVMTAGGMSIAGQGHRLAAVGGVLTNWGGMAVSGTGHEVVMDGASLLGNALVVDGGDGNSVELKNGARIDKPVWNNSHMSVGNNGSVLRVEGQGSAIVQANEWAPIRIGQWGASNRLEVVDGGRLANAFNLYIGMEGGGMPYTNNVLRVENGTVDLMNDWCGYQRGLIVTSGGRLEIAGTNSAIDIAKHLVLEEYSVIRFEIGKVAPVRPPIKAWRSWANTWLLAYGSTQYEYCFESDGTGRMEIDAKQFALAGGGKVVLMEMTAQNYEAYEDPSIVEGRLLDLASRVTWEDGVNGTVSVEFAYVQDGWYQDESEEWLPRYAIGWQLVANVANKAGTMLLLR